ncbi:uncharacterized protein LOC129745642 [Uranotaenia lowii]|uniref:uncharacterized protein LOC129745642 n=1 Tax=Uranotaenia lowii TaxID=190385 RepID=UPI00247880EC|nr:uncharacterized protein LOC129745642 [Uranotaenia lowii]
MSPRRKSPRAASQSSSRQVSAKLKNRLKQIVKPKGKPPPHPGKMSKIQPVPKPENFPKYLIPQSKLDAALRFLESDQPYKQRQKYWCSHNIAARSISKYCSNGYGLHGLMAMARHCAQRALWPELMQLVNMMCEDFRKHTFLPTLKTALYGIVADPTLSDPALLEAFLYANARCTNKGDVEYCMEQLMKVFQGKTTDADAI